MVRSGVSVATQTHSTAESLEPAGPKVSAPRARKKKRRKKGQTDAVDVGAAP